MFITVHTVDNDEYLEPVVINTDSIINLADLEDTFLSTQINFVNSTHIRVVETIDNILGRLSQA